MFGDWPDERPGRLRESFTRRSASRRTYGINLAQPFSLRLTITNPPQGLDNPYASTGNPFPFTPLTGEAAQTYAFTRPVTLSHFHPDFRNAIVQQWNVNVQQEIGTGYVATVRVCRKPR